MSMRRLINLVETAQAVDEKYTADNSALLRYMKDDRFDPYHAWWEICHWIEQHGYLDEVNDALGSDFESAMDMHDEEPDIFYKLDPDLQKKCAEAVADDMMANDPASAATHQHMMLSHQKLLPRTTWLIHFSNNAETIGYNGFKYGMNDMDRLGLTTYYTDEAKQHGGYNFAFQANSRDALLAAARRKYGRHAVMFQHSGVVVDHHGDAEEQVVFYGSEVEPRSIVILVHRDDEWQVLPKMRLKSGRNYLFKGEFEDCVRWVQQNFVQYRRAMTGA